MKDEEKRKIEEKLNNEIATLKKKLENKDKTLMDTTLKL